MSYSKKKNSIKIILILFLFLVSLLIFLSYYKVNSMNNINSIDKIISYKGLDTKIIKKEEKRKLPKEIKKDLLSPKNSEIKMAIYAMSLDSKLGPITYFNQGDIRWGDYDYGENNPLYIYGCGPTVMAMAITSISHKYITPDIMADTANELGCFVKNEGSSHNIIKKCSNYYKVPVKKIESNKKAIINALNKKKLVIALVGKGKFTDKGHFLLITKKLKKDMVEIADPISEENTNKPWKLDFIIKQLKTNVADGPLWAIG